MIRLPRRSGPRLTCLVVLAACAGIWPVALRYVLPALSPFLWATSIVATRALGIVLLLTGLPMLALVAWRRRWFCRNLCPVGWTVELCARARPSVKGTYPRVPRIGSWLLLVTIGGAALACPLFLLLDPLVLFSGAAGVPFAPLSLPHAAYAAGFVVVVALSLAFPFMWCRRVCPLGAAQDLIVDVRELVCRDKTSEDTDAPPRGIPLARRTFAGLGIGAAGAVLFQRTANATPRLRPPGAVDEATMATLCVRCGNCVRSCPTGIIQPDLVPSDVTALLTPVIRFDGDHCLETCRACGANCPTGAIASLPLAEKNARKIGLAAINEEACLLAIERDCSACVMVCPHQAVVEEFSKQTYTTMVRIDADKCNGCGACIAACPPNAIVVK